MATRRFSRVAFRIEATVKTTGHLFTGNVENLSMNGMFLATGEVLPLDEQVEISMVLTGSDPEISLCFKARVCRLTDEGIGFRFEKIDLDSYTHLKNIIAYNIDDSEKVMEEIFHSIDERLAPEN